MSRPNFFCDVDSLNCLLGKEFEGEHENLSFTMDLIELPYFFSFEEDDENWILKAMERREIYSHEDSDSEKGAFVVNKESGEAHVKATADLADLWEEYFTACMNLGCYMRENKLDELAADFDPDHEGIMLYMEGDELKHKVVSGDERPDMMVMTLLGRPMMGRPYMEDFLSKFALGFMSFEEKIEAAEDGDEDAMRAVANAYLNGEEDEDIEADPAKALYWFEKSAEEGDSSSAFNAGLFYAKGYGVERNLEKAAEWMERAAGEGDEDAKALAPKYRQAMEDLPLAEEGNAAAQGRLASFYMMMARSLEQAGTGGDYAESLKWAKLAADRNDGEGLWVLALAYEHGRGVEKDEDMAIEYYKRGAEAGYARSINSLGGNYIRGELVDQDMRLGYELILRASLLGDGEAMQNLGRCYQFGYGCMGNMKKAIFWYKKSLELVPDEELRQKVMIFESLPDAGEEDDYESEGSDCDLTPEGKAFVEKIDAALPEDVRKKAQNPDALCSVCS